VSAAEWIAAPVPDGAAELERVGLPRWMAVLLARRGVTDEGEARRFLQPSLDQLHDPFLLYGMESAVERLLAARARHEKVAIVGDYDVDGVTATAILLAVLKNCGCDAVPIVPHRLREGYGFQPVHVERARAEGCAVILTADCGSSAIEAVEQAVSAGIDVVVTDHHLPGCELPLGTVHINPRQQACCYPFRDLAAAGLALKLALAFAGRCGKELDPAPLLRIACLGTIADLVPLRGENRVIASLGLTALADVRSAGLKALLQQAGVKAPFSAADVGFRIGPRINAAGRLHEAERALELLLSRDPKRAAELAVELDSLNRDRQAEEAHVVEEAFALFAKLDPLPPILVGWSPEWHKGVVGIAAGRVAKELHRPTLLLAVEEGVATGSGRSIHGLDLHGFLLPWKERMVRFGGHTQAVGLTVGLDALEELKREWEIAGAAWPAGLLARRHEYELELEPRRLTGKLVAQLARLEPYGMGNPRPLVRTGPLRLDGPPRLFGNGHLSARARGADSSQVDLVGWGWQERATDLDGAFEALGWIEHDDYRGGPCLRLLDSRPAGIPRESVE
jgi:single-stranded-DNA-specific exonuclease